ncbi:hypothetical protein [Rossellomorea sp. NPDC077527]|uniref:hypothetical protein n=1 Tax=Rossellomorea sp. NPDC077527 TaxID=3364510 RepID=UPI0037C61E9E
MSKEVILALIMFIITIGLICIYLMNKYKQQAVKVISLESFLHHSTLDEDTGQKKSIVDSINDYFDDGHGDSGDHGDDDGGDDGGD